MRLAVTAAAAGTGSREELEEAARGLVEQLRGEELAPEQMLIKIKAFLADAGLQSPHGSPMEALPPTSPAAIYRDVISWSIRAYYGDGHKD